MGDSALFALPQFRSWHCVILSGCSLNVPYLLSDWLSSQGRERNAIEEETTQGESRWKMVGVEDGDGDGGADMPPCKQTATKNVHGNRYRCQQISPV